MPEHSPKIDLRIPADADNEVREHAQQIGVNPSDIVRAALELYFAQEVGKPVSFKVKKPGGDYRSAAARKRRAKQGSHKPQQQTA